MRFVAILAYWVFRFMLIMDSWCVFFGIFSYADIKKRVWDGRLESPLFDIKQYAHDMEVVYKKMWDRYRHNVEVDHILESSP